MNENVLQSVFSAVFLASILRVATPILLPSLGALVSDRAGVINIGLEGMMLASAFTGVVVSAYSQTWFGSETGKMIGPWLGLVMGVSVAVLLALILGVFHLHFKADLILSGIALNLLGSAGTVAVMYQLTGDRGNTSKLSSLQIPFIQLPEFLNQIPIIGPFVFQVFTNQSIMTWIAVLATIFVWFLLYRTSFGMRLRAVGENTAAAESVGIPVRRTRYVALILSGIFAGLGGIHMSMGYLTLFQRDMTAGRGFIALATPLLGGNNPFGTAAASLVFGFFDALANRIGSLQIPSQLPQMVPYAATVVALAVYAVQTQQTQRILALRAAEGERFNASFWRNIQRLSLLHILLMVIAVIGAFVAVAVFVTPNGFGGPEVANQLALMLGFVSAALIVLNLPFLRKVENISSKVLRSSVAATLSLGIYLGLFLSLFFAPVTSIAIGLVLGFTAWAILGGLQLLRMPRVITTTA